MTVELDQREDREVLLPGNELAIEGHGETWRVETGVLAVFAVQLRDGLPRGQRRHLFDIAAGEIAVKIERPADARHALIAVAIQPAVLAFVDSQDLHSTHAGRTSLQGWTSKLDDRTPSEFFASLAEIDQLAESEALARLQQQRELNRHQATASLEVLTGGGSQKLSGGTPLVDSVLAIASAQGFKVRVPASLSGAKDPLQAMAYASGFRTRSVALRARWWTEENGPLLAYTIEGDRPIALIPSRRGRYEYIDPIAGNRRPVDSAFAATLKPAAHCFYRPFSGTRTAWDLLQFALRGYGQDIRRMMLCAAAVAMLGMAMPQAMSLLIVHAIPDADQSLLLQITLGMATTVLGATLFDLTRALSALRIQSAMNIALETAAWDWLLKLSPSFFRCFSAGELQSRMEGFGRIQAQLQPEAQRAFSALLTVTLYLGLMLYYSVPLAMCAALCAVIVLAIGAHSARSLSRVEDSLEFTEGRLSGLIVQLINAVPKLRVAGAEQRAFASWARAYSGKQRFVEQSQHLRDRLRVVNSAIPTLAVALAFHFALRTTGLDLGGFLAFTMALGIFMQAVTDLTERSGSLITLFTHWKRIKPVLDAPPEVDSTKSNPGPLTGRLALDQVTFRYRKEGKLTLENVSLQADPGECIALVGPSGSGKSTIVNLLLGFETPISGTVQFDGQDLSGLDLHAVRRQIGVVQQDSRLMAESIFENIVCGSRCTLEDAWAAARAAGLAEDIEQMPMGMHTVVSEGGSNLSGGQRQRLLIARALVQRPKILLFDEATSAVDNRTQQIVTESLEGLNATRVIVAHRLSTIRQADRIYVIDAGRIVQQGTFADLASSPGLFAQLVERQLL